HGHLALARLELTGDQLEECRLPRSVRAEQARDPRRHVQRDVVQSDHLAVPLRHVRRGDDRRGLAHATTSTPRTRRSSTNAASATSVIKTASDSGQGVSYRSGKRKIASPTWFRS